MIEMCVRIHVTKHHPLISTSSGREGLIPEMSTFKELGKTNRPSFKLSFSFFY